MKKFIQNIKSHKVITGVAVGCIALALVGVGFFAYGNAKRIANSQKAMELAARDGGVSSEELHLLESDGGFAEFGTEFIDPNTSETVILTQDENGNIIRTVVADKDGNRLDANIPSTQNEKSQSYTESSHTHSWVPEVRARTVNTGNNIYVLDWPETPIYEWRHSVICNKCGANMEGIIICSCGGGSCHDEYHQVQVGVSPEVGHYEPETITEYYTVYVCSCGAQQ